MFLESAFITREFARETVPVLERITSLSVVNTGDIVAVVNGVTIYPTQKQILIVPDGTYSNVQLEITYLEASKGIKKGFSSKCRVLLIYKKLI